LNVWARGLRKGELQEIYGLRIGGGDLTGGPKLSFLVTFPQAEIGLPSAPTKRGPEVEAEDLCGNTETAAPVSTRIVV
jgi:hypothetical protein